MPTPLLKSSQRHTLPSILLALFASLWLVQVCGADDIALSPAIAELGPAWSFSNGGEFPGAAGSMEADAEGMVHLHFDFSGGGSYVGVYRKLEPHQNLESVSFRLRKPTEASITVRVVDDTGQTFQKSLVYRHADWQVVEFDMTNWGCTFGGADDGVLQQPLREIGILVESSGLREPKGEVLIADLKARTAQPEQAAQYERGAHAGEYVVTDFDDNAGFGVSGPGRLADGMLSADFSQGDSVGLHHSLALFGKPQELRLTVEGGQPGNVLKMQFGSHFQAFGRTVGTLDGKRQTFTFPVPPEGWEHWGGENDGEARLPLRLTALILERGDGPATPTQLDLVDVRCTTTIVKAKAVTLLADMAAKEPTGQARPLSATCTAWNLLDQPLDGALRFELVDWDGNVLKTETTPWVLPAKGERMERSFEAEIPVGLKFAEARFTYEAAKQRPAKATATFTLPIDDAGDAMLHPESPWGMGVYLYRYGHSPEGHAEMDRAAALAQAAGVKWSREEFSWARMEPEQGAFDFDFYDVVVDTANRHGISVYGLLSYWSNWTEPYTEKGIDDFCVWARAVVGHFKDRVKHWEIYNEPNIFFWSGPKELYPVLVKRCYAAIKEADPEAVVLAVSTAGIDTAFIQRCLDADAPFDVLTIHPYRGSLKESEFVGQLRSTAEQVGGRPVWITEMGWSTQVGYVGERTQAQLLARSYLSAVASGACQSISWYDFRNDGTDRFYNEANFGVLYQDFRPKPAYRALATVCRTLAQGEWKGREDFGEGVFALTAGNATALWSGDKPATVQCRVVQGEPKAHNLMGDPLTLKQEGDIITLDLAAGAPVFVTSASLEPTNVSAPKPETVIRF